MKLATTTLVILLLDVSYIAGMNADFDFPFTSWFAKATVGLQLEEELEEAIELNVLGRVKELINQRVHIGTHKHLALAARHGYKDIVQLLLQKKARVHKEYHSSLGKASPLHEAAAAGYNEIIELLLEYKAPIDDQASIGSTPLHQAVYAGHKNSVLLLLCRGADVNALSSKGETPLAIAIQYHKPEIAEILINSGACIQGNSESSALHRAVLANNFLLAELLLAYGSKSTYQHDLNGCTPLDYAQQHNYQILTELLTHYPVVLKEAQQRPTRNLLYTAVCNGYYYLTCDLILQGIKPDLQLLTLARVCCAQAEHKEPYRLIGRLLISYLKLMHGVGTSVDTRGPLSKSGLGFNVPEDVTHAIARLILVSKVNLKIAK